VELKTKEWLDLYAKISESISDLVIILDSSFEIIYSNQKAASNFLIDDYSITLEQVFNNEIAKKMTDEVAPTLFTNGKRYLKRFQLELKTGAKFEYDLIVTPVEINNDKLLLLVFSNKELNQEQFFVDRIQINPGKEFFAQQDENNI
jgi:nitrogen-specific signal transduction histidine kinase